MGNREKDKEIIDRNLSNELIEAEVAAIEFIENILSGTITTTEIRKFKRAPLSAFNLMKKMNKYVKEGKIGGINE
jgi:hypothetical protein